MYIILLIIYILIVWNRKGEPHAVRAGVDDISFNDGKSFSYQLWRCEWQLGAELIQTTYIHQHIEVLQTHRSRVQGLHQKLSEWCSAQQSKDRAHVTRQPHERDSPQPTHRIRQSKVSSAHPSL